MNGDGRDDIVEFGPLDVLFAAQSNGDRFGRNRYRGESPCVAGTGNLCSPFVADYDNDGDDDILNVWDSPDGVKCIIAEAGKQQNGNRYRYKEVIQSGGCHPA